MSSVTRLQRTFLQQLLRAQPFRSSLRQQLQAERNSFRTHATRNQTTQLRSLHTPRRTAFTRPNVFQRVKTRTQRFASTAGAGAEENLSLSQRLKKLSREYGWSALGVYLLLTALDFPFCFLAVRALGTDRIGHWEHVIVSKIKEFVSWPFDNQTQEVIDGAVSEVESAVVKKIPVQQVRQDGQEKRILEEEETYIVADHGYKEAEEANSGSDASIWTQLALAYAIHKSFIFIRVPLTVAVTPKVVKTLRSWGWNVGKRPTTTSVPTTSSTSTKTTPAVNTKGSGVKSD